MQMLPLIGALLLGACAPGGSDVLPPIKAYSLETQAKAADELEAMPEGAVLPLFMADYAVLREQIRAARDPKGGPF